MGITDAFVLTLAEDQGFTVSPAPQRSLGDTGPTPRTDHALEPGGLLGTQVARQVAVQRAATGRGDLAGPAEERGELQGPEPHPGCCAGPERAQSTILAARPCERRFVPGCHPKSGRAEAHSVC